MFNDPLHGITNNKGPTFYPFLQMEGREHLMNNNKYGDPWYSLLNFRQICCAQHNGSKMTGHRLEDGTSVTGYIHERSEVDVPGLKGKVVNSAWKAVPSIIGGSAFQAVNHFRKLHCELTPRQPNYEL